MKKKPQPKPCDAPCPKCGSLDIHRVLLSKERRIDIAKRHPVDFGEFAELWGETRYENVYGTVTECIHHHCRTCQFNFATAPLT